MAGAVTVAEAAGVMILLLLFRKPIGSLLRLLGRTAAGLCALAVFAPVGSLLGAGLGVNLLNALVLGALGVPGFGLLLMLRWVLR